MQSRPLPEYRQTTIIQGGNPDQGVIRMQSQPYPPSHIQHSPNPNITRTYVVDEQQQRENTNGPVTSQTFTSSNYAPVNAQQQQPDQNRNIQYTQNYAYSYNSQKPVEGSSP